MKLTSQFYLRKDTIAVARDLLGKLLVVPDENGDRVSGVIVETEAYLGIIDKGAHTFGGRRTPRNEVNYGLGGHVYVFFIYGMYYQFNVVTGPKDFPNVVLVRAIEPVEGIETMRGRRGLMKDKNLTSGPGKLCIALGIDRGFNGEDLRGEHIWIEEGPLNATREISVGKRIGIDYAGADAEQPWRFWLAGNEYVSRSRKLRAATNQGRPATSSSSLS